MKKYSVAFVVIVAALVFGTSEVAQAHVLTVDGDIGAVLHILPDDNPMVGESTQYVLSFSGTSLNLTHCNCRVHIIEDGQEIATQPLKLTNDTVGEGTYTFMRPAVYTLEVTGAPTTPGVFQSFKLQYEVRVAGGIVEAKQISPLLGIALAVDVGFVLLISFAYLYNDTRNQSTRRRT